MICINTLFVVQSVKEFYEKFGGIEIRQTKQGAEIVK